MECCTSCGAKLRKGAKFCQSCGAPAAVDASPAPVRPAAVPLRTDGRNYTLVLDRARGGSRVNRFDWGALGSLPDDDYPFGFSKREFVSDLKRADEVIGPIALAYFDDLDAATSVKNEIEWDNPPEVELKLKVVDWQGVEVEARTFISGKTLKPTTTVSPRLIIDAGNGYLCLSAWSFKPGEAPGSVTYANAYPLEDLVSYEVFEDNVKRAAGQRHRTGITTLLGAPGQSSLASTTPSGQCTSLKVRLNLRNRNPDSREIILIKKAVPLASREYVAAIEALRGIERALAEVGCNEV